MAIEEAEKMIEEAATHKLPTDWQAWRWGFCVGWIAGIIFVFIAANLLFLRFYV